MNATTIDSPEHQQPRITFETSHAFAWRLGSANTLLACVLFSTLLHLLIAACVFLSFNEHSKSLPDRSGGSLQARLADGGMEGLQSLPAQERLLPQAKGQTYAPFIPWISESNIFEPLAEEAVQYAAPDSIDKMATVIEAPVLPLPTTPLVATGQLRIKLFISEEGVVDSAELIESTLPEDYANLLLECFREARFSPGMQSGKSIRSWRVVEIDYTTSS